MANWQLALLVRTLLVCFGGGPPWRALASPKRSCVLIKSGNPALEFDLRGGGGEVKGEEVGDLIWLLPLDGDQSPRC